MALSSLRSASVAVLLLLLPVAPVPAQTPPAHTLMPAPASITVEPGVLALDAHFAVAFDGYQDAMLQRAVDRMLLRITALTGVPIVRSGGTPALTISSGRPAHRVQAVAEDESYTLQVAPAGARLRAATPLGVLRGLETFVQMVEVGPSGFAVRAATVTDRPRFPWRGLMIDVSRHFMPVAVIERNLDAMAAVKLNVLHWHLSDDQGFRVESRRFPLLQGKGSDGLYYTQDQIREVVRYAADRGIRVVPEFDIPGHTWAWLVGYPSLSAGRGPFPPQRQWDVFDPVMNPANERVYAFLDRFLGEMIPLFPDAYFHIGGDEVNGAQWSASPSVVAFRKRHGLKTNEDLQAYFNRRVAAMLARRGRTMMGWDEVLHEGLPAGVVIHSWRGQQSLADAARRGHDAILSNGYYLDLMAPAGRFYGVDPLGKAAADLPEQARKRILGGEACMWAEWVTPETIDSRIWPRTAAIAERLWSPADLTDVPDMYRRLAVESRRLEVTGVTHRTNYLFMLERLTGGRPVEALENIVDLVEPVKGYNRGKGATWTSLQPFVRVVDAARPESDAARVFSQQVDTLLADPARKAGREAVAAALRAWQASAAAVEPVMGEPLLKEVSPIVEHVATVSRLGLRALDALDGHTRLTLSAAETEALSRAGTPVADVLLAVAPPVKKLVDAAAQAR